jgi:long-chain acyl-CoA synthetase
MVTYADRPWLKHYDPGVPHTLKPYPEIPVFKFLQENAQKQPNATALIASAKVPIVGRQATHITYAQLDRLSDALACGLVEA